VASDQEKLHGMAKVRFMHRLRPESSAGPFQRILQRRELDDVAQMDGQFNYPAVFQKYHCAVISLMTAEKKLSAASMHGIRKGGVRHWGHNACKWGHVQRNDRTSFYFFGEIRQTRWVVLRRILPIPFEMDAFSKIMSRKQEFENLAVICPCGKPP